MGRGYPVTGRRVAVQECSWPSAPSRSFALSEMIAWLNSFRTRSASWIAVCDFSWASLTDCASSPSASVTLEDLCRKPSLLTVLEDSHAGLGELTR